MAKVFRDTKDMTEGAWLEARREGIGGSDVGVIAGLSPYKSPMMLYLNKIGELPDEQAGEAAEWGHILEPIIAEKFKVEKGFHVQRRNAILQHEEYPFMLANVDRLYRDPSTGEWGVLEVKTASEYKKGEWDGDTVPETYYLQLQHYLLVTGFKEGHLAVLIGGNKYRSYKVEANAQVQEYLVQLESAFWQMVTERRMPAMDGSEATANYLKKVYATAEKGKAIELPAEAREVYDAMKSAAEEAKAWADKENLFANQLKAMIGDAEIGMLPGGGKVRWSTVNQTRFDTAALAADHPELAEKYKKASSYRKFTA